MQIPVLVSKQIVYEDAIKVSYGFGRVHERKSCFDVLLDRYHELTVSYWIEIFSGYLKTIMSHSVLQMVQISCPRNSIC